MSDCLIFAVLFACYGVLGRNYAAGPSGPDLFDLKLVAFNTAMLLFSSITYGFAMLEMEKGRINPVRIWLCITGLFGFAFLFTELSEFAHLMHEGATPQRSAFLSSFYALVGTHGLHVTFGIVWLGTLLVQIGQRGLVPEMQRRLMCLSLFWHFLDVVWIGVFTFVYLIGVPAMSAGESHTAAARGDGAHVEVLASHDQAGHGSLRGYLTGFVLSVVLTAIPFWIVMGGVIADGRMTALVVMAFAVVQIVVHMVYFLHMNTKSEGGWTMLALIFTVVLVVITLSGSLWIMYHLNANMMPHDMQNMP